MMTPRYLAIFVVTDKQTNRWAEPIGLPLAHVCRVTIMLVNIQCYVIISDDIFLKLKSIDVFIPVQLYSLHPAFLTSFHEGTSSPNPADIIVMSVHQIRPVTSSSQASAIHVHGMAGITKACKILQLLPNNITAWPMLISVKTMANTGYSVDPGTSSQSEEYSSKWLIWLLSREPLHAIWYYILYSRKI